MLNYILYWSNFGNSRVIIIYNFFWSGCLTSEKRVKLKLLWLWPKGQCHCSDWLCNNPRKWKWEEWHTQLFCDKHNDRVSESDVVTSITVIDSYNSVVCEYSSGISMVMTVWMCGHCVMCGVRLMMNTSCQENWKYWSPHVLASHQYRASLPVPWSPDHLSVTSSQSEASHQGHWPIRGQVMTTYCARDSLIISCRIILCHHMLGHQAPRPGSQGNNNTRD